MRSFWRRGLNRETADPTPRRVGEAEPRAEAERLRWERDQALARVARLERRRGRPALAAVGATIVVVALLSLGVLALAVSRGSFAAGGAEVDQQVATATAPARDLAADAAARSGEALRHAGENLEAQGRQLQSGQS